MTGVGTRQVFEDDRVIVWYFDLEPGERGSPHAHQLDYTVRVLQGATLEVYGPAGELLYTAQRAAGDALCFRVQGDQIVSPDPSRPPIPATHSVRNIGTTTFREVLIEFKDACHVTDGASKS